jgi:hypothetical protein
MDKQYKKRDLQRFYNQLGGKKAPNVTKDKLVGMIKRKVQVEKLAQKRMKYFATKTNYLAKSIRQYSKFLQQIKRKSSQKGGGKDCFPDIMKICMKNWVDNDPYILVEFLEAQLKNKCDVTAIKIHLQEKLSSYKIILSEEITALEILIKSKSTILRKMRLLPMKKMQKVLSKELERLNRTDAILPKTDAAFEALARSVAKVNENTIENFLNTCTDRTFLQVYCDRDLKVYEYTKPSNTQGTNAASISTITELEMQTRYYIMVPNRDSTLIGVETQGVLTPDMVKADVKFYDASTKVVKKLKASPLQVRNNVQIIEMKFFFVTRHITTTHYLFKEPKTGKPEWKYLLSGLSTPGANRNMKMEDGFNLDTLTTQFNEMKTNPNNKDFKYTIWNIFDSAPYQLGPFFSKCTSAAGMIINFKSFMFNESLDVNEFKRKLGSEEWYIFQYQYMLDCKYKGTIWLFLSRYDFEEVSAFKKDDGSLDTEKLYTFLTTKETNFNDSSYPSMKTCLELYLKDQNNRRTINRPPYSWLFPDPENLNTAYGTTNGFSESVFIPLAHFDDFMSEKEMDMYLNLVNPETDIAISFVY